MLRKKPASRKQTTKTQSSLASEAKLCKEIELQQTKCGELNAAKKKRLGSTKSKQDPTNSRRNLEEITTRASNDANQNDFKINYFCTCSLMNEVCDFNCKTVYVLYDSLTH
jgi:hypothetical protein